MKGNIIDTMENNNSCNFKISDFIALFISFLAEYDCFYINLDNLRSYIISCKENELYPNLLSQIKISDGKIDGFGGAIDKLVSKEILEKVSGEEKIYEVTGNISTTVALGDKIGFAQTMMDFVDNYYENYLNDEYEDVDDIIYNKM